MRPIGYTTLFDIEYVHRRASFGILIGEKDCWGRGYGTEVTRLALDYGFATLGLHNIMLKVVSSNIGAIRAYQRAGFKTIGVRRESRRSGAQVEDNLYMDCLSTDYERAASPSAPAARDDTPTG